MRPFRANRSQNSKWFGESFNGSKGKGVVYENLLIISIGSALLFLFSPVVLALDFFVFPSQGQSEEQMQRDKVECQIWAQNQTGFNPLATPTATAPPPSREARQGGLLRGGARGAAVGAVGGAIAGDAGRGAAIGASTGALFGGMRRSDQLRREQQAQQQWAQQQAADHAHAREQFNRAMKACLQGKGYTVN